MAWISNMLPLPLRRGVVRALDIIGMNSNPPPVDEDANFTPFGRRSLDNLLATRDILLRFFPPELVYTVLHLAEYWPILDGCTHKGEQIHLRIARVEFKTFSHDQGSGSEEGLRGTYAGHSWFEAAILRPSQAPNAGPWITLAEDGPVRLDPQIWYDPELEITRTGPGGGGRWMVQRNFCADHEFREHVVTWDAGAVGPESDNGAGNGDGFVAQLTSGDRIGVIARARFPGWSNVVERVEVSVSYSLA
ncbi:hypothetical protein C8R47DRAFT_1218213 [Mycena vitilis]|nr:hypothetical protein C8R47DRAFT_1218213 [Mycena vitilis]